MVTRLKSFALIAAIGVVGFMAVGCDSKEKAGASAETVDISTALPASKVKELLTGNTLETVQMKDGRTMRRFYAKDGTLVPPGKTGGPTAKKARWRVNEQGQECIQSPRDNIKEWCVYIVGNERDGYVKAGAGGKIVSRVVSVTRGNPGKL